jgi:hypothetical protein
MRFRRKTSLLGFMFLIASLQGFGQDDSSHPVFCRHAIFVGPFLAYDGRDGYVDISDIKKSVSVHRDGLWAFGLTAGARTPLSQALRLQAGLDLDFGSVADDTLFTAETVTVRNYYYHAGLEPQLQFAPWQLSGFAPYLCAGAGVNCVWVQERTFLLHKPAQEILYTDRKYISAVSFSFCLCAGLGCDISINNRLSLFLSDSFRYLYPVSYRINQDFPLYEMPYHEAWFGNIARAGLSFKLR